jgi:2-oxoglutarate ferredoxin oxidoreductase subunit beta
LIWPIGEKDLDPVVHEPAEATAKLIAAIKLAQEWGDRIPIGVFYQNELVPTFEDRIGGRISTYIDQPPAFSPIADEFGASTSGREETGREETGSGLVSGKIPRS